MIANPCSTSESAVFSSDTGLSEWPPEMRLLLTCARLELEDRHVVLIRSLIEDGLDWNRFLRLTALHRMTAFVFNNLSHAAPDLVASAHLDILRNHFLLNGAEALKRTAELLKILEMLREGGVESVPYKGYALGVLLYGNLAYRYCSDQDILVTRSDVPRARELLESAGFVPQYPMSPAGRDFILKTRHSEIFVRESSLALELHWAFSKLRGVFPLDLEQLRPRLTEISLGGSLVPVFAPEDQLLVLCVHGANHLWSRLEWLCGISELIRRYPLAWDDIGRRARELRAERKLALGLLLARDLLDCPVPAAALALKEKDRDVIRSARIVKERFASGQIEHFEAPNAWPRDLFRLRLESNKDKVHYLVHRMTTPGREDTRLMLPLGRRSVPLPAVFRPFHIVGKLLSDLVRPQSDDNDGRKR